MTDYFGPDVAAHYDEGSAEMFDPGVVVPAVDVLADLAGGGRALEFGIGTGRLALPLSERGVEVHGIDLSTAMVDQLRRKPGGDRIQTTIGDFSSTRVPGPFALVYLVFNTIMNLTSQEAQVDCFVNAGAHLSPGGRFVVEVMVPELRRLPPGQLVHPFTVTPSRLGFDEYDVAEQRLVSHHYERDADGAWRGSSVPFRYVWPAELDLMARIAGMALQSRWADWSGSPFTSDSRGHVSVWRKAPA